ncbi:response regulator [bacterium]|nr:response regulator [bacterium]
MTFINGCSSRYFDNLDSSSRTLKALIIYDVPAFSAMLQKYLDENGYGAIEESSWENALHVYNNCEADIILAGIPDQHHKGLEILKSFNFEEHHKEVIIFTPHHEINLSLQALRLGVCTIIASPISPDDLDNAMQKAAKRILQYRKLLSFEEKMSGVSSDSIKLSEPDDSISKEFIQGTIHNLNGPLSVVSGNAQLLQMGLENLITFLNNNRGTIEHSIHTELIKKIDHYGEYLISMLKAGDKMRDMICTLLTKWKNDHSRLSEALNVNELIRLETEYLNASMTFRNHIKKTFLFVEDIPHIEAVYSDFSQTFHNLISNAIDAMHDTERKELTIKTWHDTDIIYIEIRDTGCGISEENRDNIFKPFFTTKGFHKEKSELLGGTGLGLTSCLSLMERYGATFTISSKVNAGTSVIWKIPKEQSLISQRRLMKKPDGIQVELF